MGIAIKKQSEIWRKSSKFLKLRKVFMSENPYCDGCKKFARKRKATDLDHKMPHREDYELFWDINNWQGLCRRCHGRKCATEDGAFGNPVRSVEWPDIGQVDFDYTNIKDGSELFDCD